MSLPSAALGAALLTLLTNCAETGDFGRPRTSVWNDAVLPATGAIAAAARGEPVSPYALTDDEVELRQRAWRFVMPAHEKALFEAKLANLVLNRVLPAGVLGEDRTVYYRALLAQPYTSPTSRYRRLGADIYADRALIFPLRRAAGRVMSADLVRRRAMDGVVDLTAFEAGRAAARMAENAGLIGWVRSALHLRVCRYRFALEHFVVEAPQADAVPAERALAALELEQRALDTLDIGPLVGSVGHPQAGPWLLPLPACRGRVDVIELRAGPAPALRPLVTKD